MSFDEYDTFCVESIVVETEEAYLFEVQLGEDTEEIWFPKSQVEYEGDGAYYPEGEWRAPCWLLENEGLL